MLHASVWFRSSTVPSWPEFKLPGDPDGYYDRATISTYRGIPRLLKIALGFPSADELVPINFWRSFLVVWVNINVIYGGTATSGGLMSKYVEHHIEYVSSVLYQFHTWNSVYFQGQYYMINCLIRFWTIIFESLPSCWIYAISGKISCLISMVYWYFLFWWKSIMKHI